MQSELLTPSNERMLQGWKNKGFNEYWNARCQKVCFLWIRQEIPHAAHTDWTEPPTLAWHR